MRRVTVIKVGGSLTRSRAAAQLMRALAQRKLPDLLIVPGGGELADAVRAMQASHGLSDLAAHHMALLAMHMMAVALSDDLDTYVLADSAEQFEAAWRQGRTPIWLPKPMVLRAAEIPASWDMTSDSLAAWVAGEIAATRLLLVKSCPLPSNGSAAALIQAGVVDACFGEFVTGRDFAWRIVSEIDAALQALTEPQW